MEPMGRFERTATAGAALIVLCLLLAAIAALGDLTGTTLKADPNQLRPLDETRRLIYGTPTPKPRRVNR